MKWNYLAFNSISNHDDDDDMPFQFQYLWYVCVYECRVLFSFAFQIRMMMIIWKCLFCLYKTHGQYGNVNGMKWMKSSDFFFFFFFFANIQWMQYAQIWTSNLTNKKKN